MKALSRGRIPVNRLPLSGFAPIVASAPSSAPAPASKPNTSSSTMALRDYMQDLLRSQTSLDDHQEENDSIKITIIDDNSSTSLPDDNDNEDLENTSMVNFSFPSDSSGSGIHSGVYFGGVGSPRRDWAADRDEPIADDSTRIMMDKYRRRQQFLRETLSPRRASPRPSASPLHFSPSPIVMQYTPTEVINEGIVEQIPKDSQRDRMRRLRASLRIQKNHSTTPPLL